MVEGDTEGWDKAVAGAEEAEENNNGNVAVGFFKTTSSEVIKEGAC